MLYSLTILSVNSVFHNISNFAMQSKISIISFSLFILSAFLWKNIFELLKWNEQFFYNPGPATRRNAQEIIEVSHIESNCGIQYTCPVDAFPVYISTGTGEYPPKLCISGKHLINQDLIGIRGLNAAVVEPVRFDVIATRNFDTYRFNKSAEIISWLSEMIDNDILIIFTSDEASLKLTNDVTLMLNELGSGMVQNLRFRSQWYMITQKGTEGFTIYEKITFSKNKDWGEMIEFRSCIPRKIPKQRTVADDPLHENRMRARFCAGKKDEKYKGFCQESRFELIIPALLTNKSLIGNPAYSSPLFIFASDDFELLAASLGSLIHQPGVFVPLITILYEQNQTDVPSMAQMYGMQTRQVVFAKTYLEKLNQARDISSKEHPEQPFIIVIDQNVILSPDFLFFMAQTIQIIKADATVSAIGAWSCNCYSHDGDVHQSYRVEGSPKYAALVPVKARNDVYGEMIVPDVSRVQGPEACHLPSLEEENWIARPQDLTKERYFHKLVMLQQLGTVVELNVLLSNCSVSVLKSQFNTIYFNYDEKTLSNIVYCLGVSEDQFGILALTSEKHRTSNQIGSSSRPPYYFSYDKKELGRIPNVKVDKPFAMSDTYSTTYGITYQAKVEERDITNLMKKFRYLFTAYPRIMSALPRKFMETEYREQYLEKPLPECVKGRSVEQQTSCPVILTGKDEREPAPLTNNIAKYLDIYVSTTRQDFRQYSEQEQRSIASKEVITSQETMEIPKGRGFGMRTPALAGQDLERRDKNMIDKVFSKKEFKLRHLHKPLPWVPRHGISSEYKDTYKEPMGTAKRHAFSSLIEYPESNTTSVIQAVCPPGMFSTEYDTINKHTTPQAVV